MRATSGLPSHPGAAMAGELVERAVGELTALADLPARDRLLAAAWLTSLRSARTRRGRLGDIVVRPVDRPLGDMNWSR